MRPQVLRRADRARVWVYWVATAMFSASLALGIGVFFGCLLSMMIDATQVTMRIAQ